MQALSLLHSSVTKATVRVARNDNNNKTSGSASSRHRHPVAHHRKAAFANGTVNTAFTSRVLTADAVAIRASAPLGLPRYAAARSPLERSTRTTHASTSTSTRVEPEPPKLEVPKVLTSKTKKMGLAIIAAGAVAATLATVVAPLTAVGSERGFAFILATSSRHFSIIKTH